MSQAQSGETANVCQQPQKTSQYLISQLLGNFFFFLPTLIKNSIVQCANTAPCVYTFCILTLILMLGLVY